ncbi:642_t:CDS:2, partial [Gigaspora margarita]
FDGTLINSESIDELNYESVDELLSDNTIREKFKSYRNYLFHLTYGISTYIQRWNCYSLNIEAWNDNFEAFM